MVMENVLLIDDSEIDSLINKKVLEKSGYCANIHVMCSAREALNYLIQLTDLPGFPSLFIFLDIRMPDIDGFEFLEHFYQLPESIHNNTRIIMLSSSIDSDDYHKAMSFPNVIKFINKPLSKEAVVDIFNS